MEGGVARGSPIPHFPREGFAERCKLPPDRPNTGAAMLISTPPAHAADPGGRYRRVIYVVEREARVIGHIQGI